MIEYLAKTLKKMKDGCGVGSICELVVSGLGAVGLGEHHNLHYSTKPKGVENTQQKRDVQLFVKGRVLWKNQTYHQLEHKTCNVTNLFAHSSLVQYGLEGS
jgi:hypothetical protein